MSINDINAVQPPALADEPLSTRDLAAVLVKHYGLHEGRYTLSVEFQIGVGPVGPELDALLPGVMIGVSRIGLRPSETDAPAVVDAAIVNPAKKPHIKVAAKPRITVKAD
ncbi:MAG: hypothetical protein Q7S69_03030 [Nitrosomonadaceae bacterium]|nr:hypothetical protein [Nitrosomonadaceae bacterium]